MDGKYIEKNAIITACAESGLFIAMLK